jgi:predicted aspartyl protease
MDKNIELVLNNLSWSSFSADMKLDLKRGKKESLVKKMTVKAISTNKEQEILAMFTFPSNMKGMAFLASCKKDLSDSRYIYLRTLRRVKKIPSNDDNFMLRDFLSLYLLKPRVELWNYTSLSESDDTVVVQAVAKSNKTIDITGYKKLLLTIDKKKSIIISTEFYGKNDKKRRSQKVLESKIINNINFITKMETIDFDEDVKAEITLTNIKTDKISKKIFTTRYLKTL